MPQAWRIVKKKHAATAFSGKGAADYGGRWNSRGVPIVYTSGSKSLAALEILVHLNPLVILEYVAIRVEFDYALVEQFPFEKLPEDWQAEPSPSVIQQIGDVWANQARSVVLAVPSAIISGEPNFLINPAHRDFKKIRLGKPEPFTFDPRLLT